VWVVVGVVDVPHQVLPARAAHRQSHQRGGARWWRGPEGHL